PVRAVDRPAVSLWTLHHEIRECGGNRRQVPPVLFGAHDVEEDRRAAAALPQHAAIELESALIGIAPEDLPERGVDEIGIAQQDRFEPRLQPREETQKSV